MFEFEEMGLSILRTPNLELRASAASLRERGACCASRRCRRRRWWRWCSRPSGRRRRPTAPARCPAPRWRRAGGRRSRRAPAPSAPPRRSAPTPARRGDDARPPSRSSGAKSDAARNRSSMRRRVICPCGTSDGAATTISPPCRCRWMSRKAITCASSSSLPDCRAKTTANDAPSPASAEWTIARAGAS